MSDVVEKVARAIHEAEPSVPWECCHIARKNDCYAMAIAAMEALLEPTEEMVRAATDYIATNIDGGCSAHDAREVLRTAITRAMGK